jgi:hypothetical protein
LSSGTWYTGKVRIDDDGSGGERLRFWVDTDNDGTFSDETTLITDTTAADNWLGGYTGLFVGPSGTAAAQEFDNVDLWIDADSDGTMDEQQIADDFNSSQADLDYDDNGNLTDDGVFGYVYDP